VEQGAGTDRGPFAWSAFGVIIRHMKTILPLFTSRTPPSPFFSPSAAWGAFVRLNRSVEELEPEGIDEARGEDHKVQ
jgi:hypothetical protein